MPSPADRTGLWLRTYSGGAFWPTDPHSEDVNVADIAHALACQNRFGGHSREPYSVAQHCVLVSELCDPADAMLGLLHDAAEAYIVDVPRPLKYSPGMEGYKVIERGIHLAVMAKFGLSPDIPESVHRADDLLCHAEMRDLMPHIPRDLQGLQRPFPVEVLAKVAEVKPWPWYYAEEQWLARYEGLGGKRG